MTIEAIRVSAGRLGRAVFACGFLLAVLPVDAMAQGSLTPPGPPAPMMKTLDQVEARVPISSASLPLTITESGSYYLVETIRFTEVDTHGIVIDASNVSIDFNGFALIGPGREAGTHGSAIIAGGSGGATNVTVRNGMILNWKGDGIGLFRDGEYLVNHPVVESMRVQEIGGTGITINHGSVRNCILIHCGTGIHAGGFCIVEQCQTDANKYDGILVENNSRIRLNASHQNGSVQNLGDPPGDGAGIHVVGSGNRIELNEVSSNDRGVQVDSGGNLILQNGARGNGDNYGTIASGNVVGPIVTSSTIATNTNPNANFEF